MIKRYVLPSLLLLILFISGCENELPFNKEANPPKLVMNALINADSINNMLYLNKTGQSVISDVTDANVEVRVNDVLVEVPKALPIPDGDFVSYQKRFLLTTKFHPGDKVRIDAKTGDGEYHAWAEVTVPRPPIAIERVDTATVRVSEYDNYYTTRLRYRITIADRPGEKNFYRLILERRATLHATITSPEFRDTVVTKQNFKMLSREDMVLTDGNPSMSDNDSNMFEQPQNIYGVFDDSRFSGQSYTMTVYPTAYIYWPEIFPPHIITRKILDSYVRVLSISEIDFRYFKALNLIDSNVYDDMTMEPITFASN